MLFLFATTLLALGYNALEHIKEYIKSKAQNNNYEANEHYRKAVLYSILCIVFVIAFACNREEFKLKYNQFNNCPMSEQPNATMAENQSCPWAVLEHGSTVARVNSTNLAGILPAILLLAVRVKAVRFQFERNKYKTFVTRTFVIKSMPAIEQYLS